MECEGPLPTIHQNGAGLHRASCQTHSPTLIHYAIDSWQWWIEDQQKQLHHHRRVALSPGQFVIGRIRSSVDDLISDSHFNGLFILRGRTSVLTEWRNDGGLDDWRGYGSTRRWGLLSVGEAWWSRVDWRWHDSTGWRASQGQVSEWVTLTRIDNNGFKTKHRTGQDTEGEGGLLLKLTWTNEVESWDGHILCLLFGTIFTHSFWGLDLEKSFWQFPKHELRATGVDLQTGDG